MGVPQYTFHSKLRFLKHGQLQFSFKTVQHRVFHSLPFQEHKRTPSTLLGVPSSVPQELSVLPSLSQHPHSDSEWTPTLNHHCSLTYGTHHVSDKHNYTNEKGLVPDYSVRTWIPWNTWCWIQVFQRPVRWVSMGKVSAEQDRLHCYFQCCNFMTQVLGQRSLWIQLHTRFTALQKHYYASFKCADLVVRSSTPWPTSLPMLRWRRC